MAEKDNWAEGHLKKMIVDQRKFMWRDDQVERLAESMGLSDGMAVVDVGCGQGYLGWTYWKYFGTGGKYLGVDCSLDLAIEALELAGEWSKGGNAWLLNGDCYDLPLSDEIADVTMCQTLLMHLEFPRKALSEMIRVTKPGGVVMCKEPDNVSSILMRAYSTAMDESVEEMLLRRKMFLVWARGRKKAGKGDWGIGSKVPGMMHDLGLTGIDAVLNEKTGFLQPPYDTPAQKHRIKMLRKGAENAASDEKGWKKEFREFYVAGGGSVSSFYRNYTKLKKLGDAQREKMIQQLDDGTLFVCSGGSTFLCVIGRKPG